MSGEQEWRLFFAVPLAAGLRERVAQVVARLIPVAGKVKWVEPENLHFTLKFLGEMPVTVVDGLGQVARQVAARHAAFTLHILGVGAFPRPAEARVIWLGSAEGGEALTALAMDLEEALARTGLAPRERRPFKPHLTIGRNNAPGRTPGLAEALGAQAQVDIGPMVVDSFVLMRSQLQRQGPIYTETGRFGLAAG